MGSTLTADQIAHAPDIQTERIAVPEWGGDVTLRTMTADERDEFETLSLAGRGENKELNLRRTRARLLAFTLASEAGERMYPDLEAGMTAIGKRSAVPVDRLFWRARKLNALDQKDIDDLAGNSDPGRGDATSSGLPNASA